ncbi:Spy/CpxP family protein refolding chaperone [Teredinibacter purpureus]|uniref:Spy/CpxP family protein refolding chaperone n=1 Tax=Teredinibacter purpureus TaxID=2731756 RepID=UPI0005F89860|nr:Spy/CpxP family protein refolding chaperone [Teredinibacter purpureus]
MKTSSSVMIMALLATFAFSVAVAAPFGGKCGRDGERGIPLLMLERVVDLTSEQRVELEALMSEMAPMSRPAARGAIRGAIFQLDADSADYQLQVEALATSAAERARERVLQRAALHAKVQEVLTQEQRSELQAFHNDRMAMKKGGRQPW